MAKYKKEVAKKKQDLDFPNDVLTAKSIKDIVEIYVEESKLDFDIDFIAAIKKTASFCEKFFKDEDIKKLLIENADAENIDWGASLSVKTRQNLDYASCGHPEYAEVLDAIEKLTIRKKGIEKLLAGLPEPEIDPKTKKLKYKKTPVTIMDTLEVIVKPNGEVVDLPRPESNPTDYVQWKF